MLRQILHDLEWGITFAIVTIILYLVIALIYIPPVIADITETDMAPGQKYCRSEQVLTDETGHKWEVMFFTQVNSPQVASLNLRLSGLSSSVYIQSQAPLIIDAEADQSNNIGDSSGLALQPLHYEVSDIFQAESPLPSIGQYDLKDIFSQLPTSDLVLKIPLENGQSTRLQVPQAVVEEWQSVASRNSDQSPKIPSSIELFC
ncbi:MAG: DUF3122 domain-containing protein [Xenococcus sp. MO_188.B8]|nr:DUF3122 domain-containing protein [Xenococcus sp. MO_188.B8]